MCFSSTFPPLMSLKIPPPKNTQVLESVRLKKPVSMNPMAPTIRRTGFYLGRTAVLTAKPVWVGGPEGGRCATAPPPPGIPSPRQGAPTPDRTIWFSHGFFFKIASLPQIQKRGNSQYLNSNDRYFLGAANFTVVIFSLPLNPLTVVQKRPLEQIFFEELFSKLPNPHTLGVPHIAGVMFIKALMVVPLF